MITAVVPVHEEEYRVGRVIDSLLEIHEIQRIFIILNGSNEITQYEAQNCFANNRNRITLVSFNVPLGIDVPRAVGAKLAFTAGADYNLFIDGDMVGEITAELADFLLRTISERLDLALLDCYPDKTRIEDFREPMFYWRYFLNKELHLSEKLKVSTPSHGPHVISRRMLLSMPWEDFAVPPTLLVHGTRRHYRIDLAGAIPHIQLGSSIKNLAHNNLIIDTIIGDCLEALCMWHHHPRDRGYKGKQFIGYHNKRRFDLLAQFLAGRSM